MENRLPTAFARIAGSEPAPGAGGAVPRPLKFLLPKFWMKFAASMQRSFFDGLSSTLRHARPPSGKCSDKFCTFVGTGVEIERRPVRNTWCCQGHHRAGLTKMSPGKRNRVRSFRRGLVRSLAKDGSITARIRPPSWSTSISVGSFSAPGSFVDDLRRAGQHLPCSVPIPRRRDVLPRPKGFAAVIARKTVPGPSLDRPRLDDRIES